MRVRNHALDGLRGLAALGVLTLHVWMFTVQGAHRREELVSLFTGELRLGVVLFFVLSGYLLAGPWVASALEDRPTPRLRRGPGKRPGRGGPRGGGGPARPPRAVGGGGARSARG